MMEGTGSGVDQWYPYDPHYQAEIIPMSLFAGVILLSAGVAGVIKIGTSMLGLLGFLPVPYPLTPYWRNFFLIGYTPFLLMCVGFIYAAFRFLHKYVFCWRALNRESGFLVTEEALTWRRQHKEVRVPWDSIVGLRAGDQGWKRYHLQHRNGCILVPYSVQHCEELVTTIGDRSPNLTREQGLIAGRALSQPPSGAAAATDRTGAMTRERKWDRGRAALGCLRGQAVGGLVGMIACWMPPALGQTLPSFPGLLVLLPCWMLGGVIGFVAGGCWEPQPRVRIMGRIVAAFLVALWLWLAIAGVASSRHRLSTPSATHALRG